MFILKYICFACDINIKDERGPEDESHIWTQSERTGNLEHETHIWCKKKSIFSYLAKKTPSVLTKVWADGGQKQSLSLYELEDEVSVHPLDSELAILIFGCLRTNTETEEKVIVTWFLIPDTQCDAQGGIWLLSRVMLCQQQYSYYYRKTRYLSLKMITFFLIMDVLFTWNSKKPLFRASLYIILS